MAGKRKRWSPGISAACGYVLTCHPKQGRPGYLQHFDGGAGRTTEGENAGVFILKANRIKRRSLDAFSAWMGDGGGDSLSCKIDEG